MEYEKYLSIYTVYSYTDDGIYGRLHLVYKLIAFLTLFELLCSALGFFLINKGRKIKLVKKEIKSLPSKESLPNFNQKAFETVK